MQPLDGCGTDARVVAEVVDEIVARLPMLLA